MIGVPTGFAELDALTNGLHRGQLIIVAARPASRQVDARARLRPLGRDQARPADDLLLARDGPQRDRHAPARRRVDHRHAAACARATWSSADWTTLASTRGQIADAPLYIDDSPNMTLVEIRAKCRRLKQKVGLKMVVIDYLQLMTSGKKVESRQQEVSEFSRALKLLAKELKVPVIALSQLNRGPEQRADKKPALSDLRESGSLEQDADMVILLHRESAYEKREPAHRRGRPDRGEAPQRPTGHHHGRVPAATYSRFTDMPPRVIRPSGRTYDWQGPPAEEVSSRRGRPCSRTRTRLPAGAPRNLDRDRSPAAVPALGARPGRSPSAPDHSARARAGRVRRLRGRDGRRASASALRRPPARSTRPVPRCRAVVTVLAGIAALVLPTAACATSSGWSAPGRS